MKIIFLLLVLASLSECQSEVRRASVLQGKLNSNASLLIIFTGESNTGGPYASNSEATALELSDRPEVKMFNNYTQQFENLHVGVNNMLGHSGLDSFWFISHSWELEIANRVAAGLLPNPTYIVKTGEGGTTIAQWGVGGLYMSKNPWDTMQRRVDSAIAQITRAVAAPQIYVFYSQGINDILAGTNANTWEAATIAHIAKIRARYGQLPFFMTKFNMSGRTSLNAYIQDICNTQKACYAIDATGAAIFNTEHWNYSGIKLLADRLTDSLRFKF